MNGLQELVRTQILLQVGDELRVKNSGEMTLSNPQLKLSENASAADAVLLYHFDQRSGEHIIRLLGPAADHKHPYSPSKDDRCRA